MSRTFNVACVQNTARIDVDHNIHETSELTRAAHAQGADLIILPEYFTYLDNSDERMLETSFAEPEHPALEHFTALASELGCWILLGSLAIRVAPGKLNNRSYLIDSGGKIVSTYNKLHLFDVELKHGEVYRESDIVQPGGDAVVATTPWGGLGLSICYDLRFAALYRSLAQAGADFIAIPAAFTKTTGKAHWHVLQRARAIETGSYVFAPCQCGIHESGRKTYGHSLIVDPWGEVLADGGDEPGFIIAEVDPERVREARRMIPALQHDRVFAQTVQNQPTDEERLVNANRA